jgi:hypothetical protein
MSCSSKHTTMAVGAARFSKHSWTYLLQVFNIAKHKGHLFEYSNLKIPLFHPFLHNQVKISISSFFMPWYALDRLHDADSNECSFAWNGWLCWEKHGFHFSCLKLFSFDLLTWLWFHENPCHMMLVCSGMKLLICIWLISGHVDSWWCCMNLGNTVALKP